LQALACAGYGTGLLAHHLATQRMRVKAWQQRHHWQVHLSTHQRVDYAYWRLIDYDGPSTQARRYARLRGWQPIEAWTVDTIDDPTAAPYSDPAQASYLDLEAINQVRAGSARYDDLQLMEKQYMLLEHLRLGGSLRGFKDRYRPVPQREVKQMARANQELATLLGGGTS
jgi:hypothetical protein